MKKTLLSAVAGLAVIGSACAAGPDTCNPDKYVWVEKDELCIPKNPCKSKSDVIRNAYCSKAFEFVQLGNWRKGVTVVEAYLDKQRGLGMTNTGDIGNDKDTSFFGQDYIPAKTTDGGYVVFEFDDLSDLGGADVRNGIAQAVCIAYSGRYLNFERYGGREDFFSCKRVSESDCLEMAQIMTELRDGHLVTASYEPYNDGSGYLCSLTFEK